jgi:hypothetical protein
MKTPASIENARGEEELLKLGWTKQFLASGSRLEEASASYASIGLEVHLEPAQAKDLACSECQPPQPSATIEAGTSFTHAPKMVRRVRPTKTKWMSFGEMLSVLQG